MASQSRILAELEVTNGNASHIRISIVYRIGGINYFTSENQKRGLYIDVTPIVKTVYLIQVFRVRVCSLKNLKDSHRNN